MGKKLYLEILRMVALFFVLYNHSRAYMSFAHQSGCEYRVSFFLSMICKSAVPLFFMISGVLLLGKCETFGTIFRKRILRFLLILILFSFLCYVKTIVREQSTFSLIGFLKGILADPINLPYWFLYSYLAFLMMLPILRPLAQNISLKGTLYLVLLYVCFGSLKTVISDFGGIEVSGFLDISGLFQVSIFYPIIGYGIAQYIEDTGFLSKKNILRNLLLIPITVLTERIVYMEYLRTGGYQEKYLTIWTSVIAIILFLDIKIVVREERLPEWGSNVLLYIGDCVFGCYLLSELVGTGGRLAALYQAVLPVMGEIPTYILQIICDFSAQLVLVTALKKLPVFRKLI